MCPSPQGKEYFPQGILTDTTFSSNASSTWSAIEYGLELLKKGIIWRIDNGASVRAWREPSIPRESFLRPYSKQDRCRLWWVADFLKPDGSWNVELLQRWLMPMDVQDILKIKASTRNDSDFLA
jgi:hypothetical protein